MDINFDCGIEYFIKERIENNREITPQRAVIYKELLKAEYCSNSTNLNSKKEAYSLP